MHYEIIGNFIGAQEGKRLIAINLIKKLCVLAEIDGPQQEKTGRWFMKVVYVEQDEDLGPYQDIAFGPYVNEEQAKMAMRGLAMALSDIRP